MRRMEAWSGARERMRALWVHVWVGPWVRLVRPMLGQIDDCPLCGRAHSRQKVYYLLRGLYSLSLQYNSE
jgi:hypothetical protein